MGEPIEFWQPVGVSLHNSGSTHVLANYLWQLPCASNCDFLDIVVLTLLGGSLLQFNFFNLILPSSTPFLGNMGGGPGAPGGKGGAGPPVNEPILVYTL